MRGRLMTIYEAAVMSYPMLQTIYQSAATFTMIEELV